MTSSICTGFTFYFNVVISNSFNFIFEAELLRDSRAGPRHKRTKRLLRAPWPPEGPQVAYMKLQFILFYFNS